MNLLDDPAQTGLLSLGLRLMSTPGKFGAALGSAGLGAMGDVQQAKAQQQAQRTRAMQEEMLAMQVQQIKAQQERDKAMRDAAQGSYSQGDMLPADQSGPVRPGGFDMAGFAQKMAALGDPSMLMSMQPKERGPIKVGAGETLLDPQTMRPVFSAPDKAAAEDKDIALLKLIHGEGTPGYFEGLRELAKKRTTHAPAASAISYGSPVPVQLADGSIGYAQPGNKQGAAPQMMTDATGQPLKKPGEDEKPLTEGQAKAVLFASRMQAADKTLATLARKDVRTTTPGAMGNNAVGSAITAISGADQQQLGQAKRDFINAVLRRESGAVIADSEFASAERQYFPQIGDSRQVIEQKAQNRRIAIEGMKADVPVKRRGEVDTISTGGASKADDPLGLR